MLTGEREVRTLRVLGDATEVGGSIMSTGDQCGRDTPDEDVMALIEVTRTYGKY
jgi:uroporphyrinogen decarboxylase